MLLNELPRRKQQGINQGPNLFNRRKRLGIRPALRNKTIFALKTSPPLVGGVRGGGNKYLSILFATLSQPPPSRGRSLSWDQSQ